MTLQTTLGNEAWMYRNFTALKAIFNPEWTQQTQQTMLQAGFQLKLLGVDWRSQDELSRVMVYLRRVHVMQTDIRADLIFVRRHP